MTNINKYWVLIIGLALISCKKNTPPIVEEPAPAEVYLVGHTGKWSAQGILQSEVAVYWKNDKMEQLSEPAQRTEAYGIFVFQKDVYIIAKEKMTNKILYWKNKEKHFLTDGNTNAEPKSIYVYANDVYIAGNNAFAAGYWKNGSWHRLSHADRFSTATSVFVHQGDVYAAGYELNSNGKSVAMYWKNGTPYALTDGSANAGANAIAVQQDEVYVVGYEQNKSGFQDAKYWKNSLASTLSPGTTASGNRPNALALFISPNKDVFIAGYTASGAKYWKNGQEFDLGKNHSWVANSIMVHHNDLYIAGSTGYWKNGIWHERSVDGTDSTEITGIFITAQ